MTKGHIPYLLASLCLIIYLSLPAQKSLIDSLRVNISRNKGKDSFRVKAISQYLKAVVNNHVPDFLPLTNEMIEISRQIQYSPGISKGYELSVIYYNDTGDYLKSILYADTAFNLLQNDTSLKAIRAVGFLYNNRGTSFLKMGEFQKSLDDYIRSAKVMEKLNDPFLTTIYNNISEVYAEMNLEDKSIEYENLSVKKAEMFNDDDLLCLALLNQATGQLKRNELVKAEAVLFRTKALIKKLENQVYNQIYNYNTGLLYESRHLYAAAVEAYKNSLVMTRQNTDPYQECTTLSQLASCFDKLGNMVRSKKYLDTLLDKATFYSIRYFKNEVYKDLAKWYRQNDQFKLADIFMQKYTELKDSISSENTVAEISRLETRFKVEQKETEIRQLKQNSELQQLSLKEKNWLNYFLSASAIVLTVMLFLVFKNYKQKQKLQQQQINELVLEKKLTTTEAILKGEEKERNRIAKDLHDGLSGMLAGVKFSLQNMQGNLLMTPDNQQSFARSMDMLDNAIQEMRRVAQNMMPEALVQFGLDVALKDFTAEINKSGMIKTIYESMGLEEKKIEQSKAITIYRIVQELVNNVIKHARAQQVFIQLLLQENKLIINVDDNGTGFVKAYLQSSSGMGWKNILTRVEYLKGKIDVKTEPGKGTAVNIELNLTA